MKILHLIVTLDPKYGGPVQGINNYLPEFYKRGYKNEVLSLDDPSQPFIIESDIECIHALGPKKTSWSYSPKLIPWLEENIERYDFLIVHGLWQYHGYAVNQVIKKKKDKVSKLPHVYVMSHGMLDPYFQNAPDRKLKAIRNNFYWKFIESKVVNEAKGILFTCQEEQRLAGKAFTNYNPKAEHNVGYGIQRPPEFIKDMEVEFFKKCPMVANKRFLLYLGRIDQKKGVDLLIRAFKKIKKGISLAKNEEDISLVIAGPGFESAYGQMIKELVASLGLTDSIYFPGMLLDNSKWGAFYKCEAFILPSHQENFGIAIAEALACSRPVLISDKINIWKEIKDANAGFVGDDTEDGTETILRDWFSQNEDERIKMSANAIKCFDKNFTVETAITRFIDVFHRSLKKSKCLE